MNIGYVESVKASLKIGLDFDGVVVNCAKLKSRVVKYMFNLNIEPENMNTAYIVGRGLLTQAQYDQVKKFAYESGRASLDLEFVPLAEPGIRQLVRQEHEVKIITSRGPRGIELVRQFLDDNGFEEIVLVGINLGRDKSDDARGLHLFVDDDFDKLQPLVGVVPHRYLFSWPYNRQVETGAVASRLDSWPDICRIADLLHLRQDFC